jgi:hypothetical protein
MNTRDLITITDLDTLNRVYLETLGDRVNTDGSHTLYQKGIFDGMEILLKALSISIQNRAKLE